MLVLFLVSFTFNDFKGWMLNTTSFDSFNQQAIGNRVDLSDNMAMYLLFDLSYFDRNGIPVPFNVIRSGSPSTFSSSKLCK